MDEVVGGRIPRSLIPAVDKGVQETMKDGIIAGYPLTGIRVAVYDGSYHSVDSNEMAFRAAARIGLRKACADADPVVLEPIEEITVTIPESYAGAVMGDISASRGRVTGMETDERGDTVVIAQAPLAELTDYSTRLRSITRGTGDFTMKPAGYEQVPYDVPFGTEENGPFFWVTGGAVGTSLRMPGCGRWRSRSARAAAGCSSTRGSTGSCRGPRSIVLPDVRHDRRVPLRCTWA